MATNGLRAAGYKYVNIDGTWIATPGRGNRDASGHLAFLKPIPTGRMA